MVDFNALKISLDEYVENNRREMIQSFKDSSEFEVNENEEDNVCTISWEKHDGFGVIWSDPSSFEYTVNEEDLFEEFVEKIQDIVGSHKLEKSGNLIHLYERKLEVDEGNCHEFVSELVNKVESLGYSVEHEKSAGMLVGPENVQKEFKWWFYIRYDGEMPSHGFDLYFEEDGIYIKGHVTLGEKKEEEFRQILSEFSI